MKISTIALLLPILSFAILPGCSKPKALSPQQQWQQFCKTYEGAAANIMYDRQNDISIEQSMEHLKKIPEGQQREMLMVLVKQAHQVQKYDNQPDKEEAMAKFKADKYQRCLNTPHAQNTAIAVTKS